MRSKSAREADDSNVLAGVQIGSGRRRKEREALGFLKETMPQQDSRLLFPS
jgi:hypothetical protein